MRMTKVILPILALLVTAGGARAAEELERDETFPLQDNQAEPKLELGKIVLSRIQVRDVPSAAEIAKANDKYHCNVSPIVVLTNDGHHDANVDLKLTLEDDQGTVLLKCSRSIEIEEGDENKEYGVCTRGRIKTLDWPKVTKAHLVVHVDGD